MKFFFGCAGFSELIFCIFFKVNEIGKKCNLILKRSFLSMKQPGERKFKGQNTLSKLFLNYFTFQKN
jgi:hypothetical protein